MSTDREWIDTLYRVANPQDSLRFARIGSALDSIVTLKALLEFAERDAGFADELRAKLREVERLARQCGSQPNTQWSGAEIAAMFLYAVPEYVVREH